LGIQGLSSKTSETNLYFTLLTNLNSQWSRVLIEKLTVPQPVREITLDFLCLGVKGDIE